MHASTNLYKKNPFRFPHFKQQETESQQVYTEDTQAKNLIPQEPNFAPWTWQAILHKKSCT